MSHASSRGVAQPKLSNGAAHARRRVMIVDDDPAALGTLSRLVAEWGHEVVPFLKYEDARAYLSTSVPHVLVADVRLGMFNGLHLVHVAKHVRADMTVIAMTGFNDAVIRAEAASVGASYMVKPVDLE